MTNKDYKILNPPGDGDCFFKSVSWGLQTIKKYVSVEELRTLVSNKATQELYNTYKLLYQDNVLELNSLTRELESLNILKTELKSTFKKTRDRDNQKRIIKEYEEVKGNIENITLLISNQIIRNREVDYMENINNLEQLKDFMKSRAYWADTWTISTMERNLNIKFVIFSEEAYEIGDYSNILQCGQLNDVLEIFEPTHYILLSYTGEHYKLIQYKDQGAFTFDQLSIFIKDLIKDKCLERDAGPWYIIPEFKQYKRLVLPEVEPELYDDDIVFQFYSRSDGKKLPGEGSGEKIPRDQIKEYVELSKIKDWRRKLSNLWDGNTFELDGKKWKSVEHFYQGSKFKENNYDFYRQFSLDSKSELSEDSTLAKAAGGKTGKYNGKQIRDKKIEMDPNFDKIKKEIMVTGQNAKFLQNPILKDLLIKTKNAKLAHYVRGSPPVVFSDLMKLRKTLL